MTLTLDVHLHDAAPASAGLLIDQLLEGRASKLGGPVRRPCRSVRVHPCGQATRDSVVLPMVLGCAQHPGACTCLVHRLP